MSIQYPKAPIVEAIIDIRFAKQTDDALEKLRPLCDVLKDRYPNRTDLRVIQGVIQLQGHMPVPSETDRQTGFVLSSQDQKSLVQIRIDGFTFTVLSPYSNWPEFSGKAKDLWKMYTEIMAPKTLARLGLRYVNKIDIPLPVRDFRDYLRTYPEISSDMDQSINGYYMQLQCPQPAVEAIAIITEAMVPPPAPNVVSVLLDIELARSANIPNTNEESLWSVFEDLRRQKNKIFEASITSNTRELFK